VGDLGRLPLTDDTFDVIICYNAIEHLKQPGEAFAEFGRILKSGGILILKTPCIMSPVFFLSHYLPLNWHKKFKAAAQRTQEEDIFLTYYRCNTRKQLEDTLKSAGFQRKTLKSVEQVYDYLTFNKFTYAFGLLASRIMQLLPLTKPFRSQLIGVYRKSPNAREAQGEGR
jgi:ubiquinone/menaquinone biosynthesis C-methylase UbiE